MIYWIYEKEAGYNEWQVMNAIKEGRLNENEYTLIEDEEWARMKDMARRENKIITYDSFSNCLILKDIVISKKEILQKELNELESWFSSKSYIAEKIAYGRATREEYADVISQMDAKAERINEIRAELTTL